MDKKNSEIIEWEDQTAQRLGSKKKKALHYHTLSATGKSISQLHS